MQEENTYSVSQIDTFNAKRATLMFLVCKVYAELYKSHIKASHHIADSTYFVRKDQVDIPEEDFEPIIKGIEDIINANRKIELVKVKKDDVVAHLMTIGNIKKGNNISKINESEIECAKLDDYMDVVYEQIMTSTGEVGKFRFLKYDKGFLVQLPTARNPSEFAHHRLSKAQFDLQMRAEQEWKEVGADTIIGMSQYCRSTPFKQMEEWTKKNGDDNLKEVFDYVISQYPKKRIVGISGPSSSGKTTLSLPFKRILGDHGYECVTIAIDDYYKDRVNFVKKENGEYDFEHIGSIQADLLAERVKILLEGKPIPKRSFDFVTGVGIDHEEQITLSQKGFVIIEGIHGINPELLNLFAPLEPIKIYVSPMTPVRYDDEHPISQRDFCLMRRILRDNRERGYSPRTTIGVWSNVCDGEERNICPYVGEVECFYNSSFVYELLVLSEAGGAILEAAREPEEGEDPNSIKTKFINYEVKRLHRLLTMSGHMMTKRMRRNSGMAEFVGEEFSLDSSD